MNKGKVDEWGISVVKSEVISARQTADVVEGMTWCIFCKLR